MKRASKSHTQWLILAAAGLLLLVAVGERTRLRASIQEAGELRAEVTRLTSHSRALLVAVNSLEAVEPFLDAEEVVSASGEIQPLHDAEHAVLYLLSMDCPFSPSHYPLLNEVYAQGVPVVGIAVGGSSMAVERHAADWGLEFPVLIGATGSAVQRIPAFATPTLAVFSRGEVVLIEFGSLPPTADQFVRSLADSF